MIKKLFNKKANGSKTLQQLQQEFHQALAQLGDAVYRKHMITDALSKVNDEINTLNQSLDNLGKDAREVQAKLQAEVAAKVEEGKKAQEAKDETKVE